MSLKLVNDNTVLDHKTGKLYSSKNTNYLVFEQKSKIRENFMLLFQDGMKALAKDKKITGGSRRVLDYFLSVMDYDNEVYLTQKEIAEDLETTQQQISKSIKLLEELNYIKIVPTKGTVYIYKVSPDLVIRGGAKKRGEIIDAWNEL